MTRLLGNILETSNLLVNTFQFNAHLGDQASTPVALQLSQKHRYSDKIENYHSSKTTSVVIFLTFRLICVKLF